MLFRKVVLQSISAEHICRMLDTSHFSMYNFHARRFLFSQDSTFCTLSQIWTPFADYLVAIVFPVFGAIGWSVPSHLSMCSNQSIHHTYTHISWKNSLSWSFYTSGAVWFHHPKATFSIANVSYPTSATRKMCNVVHHF